MAVSSRVQLRRRASGLALGLTALVGLLSSCASEGSTASGAAATTDETSTEATAGLGERQSAQLRTTPTDDATTTDEPTTVAPATTEATTTTVAGPTTTQPAGPFNRVPVEPSPTPLAAVGTDSGAETARVQQRLFQLGFWLARADGNYELTTTQAVMAFQKYVGAPATGSVDAATAASLSALAMRPYGKADSGTMLEIDKTRQLIFILVDGTTKWVFNTSTGNDQPYREEDQNSPGEFVEDVALTPEGIHKVNRERPEGWWEGDLGQIYRPKYFVGGIAVHGSNSVPNYPASHGCVRVTTQAMDFIWEQGLMPLGLPVWVHGNPVA